MQATYSTTNEAANALTRSIREVRAGLSVFGEDCPHGRSLLRKQQENRAEAERLMPGAGFLAQRQAFPGL